MDREPYGYYNPNELKSDHVVIEVTRRESNDSRLRTRAVFKGFDKEGLGIYEIPFKL